MGWMPSLPFFTHKNWEDHLHEISHLHLGFAEGFAEGFLFFPIG
jgi:hypothetical protein